jgi:hypothetical protein
MTIAARNLAADTRVSWGPERLGNGRKVEVVWERGGDGFGLGLREEQHREGEGEEGHNGQEVRGEHGE